MIALTLQQIADAVSGQLLLPPGQDAATVISGDAQTDSRQVQSGQIFFARRGEVTDGHRFAESAVTNGAALIVCERDCKVSVPQIIVADTTLALAALAKFVISQVRQLGKLKIVGITGSNGKTSTKNLLGAMLARLGKTVASQKSFNNEVGGPLTMLRVQADTEFLVAEMGASLPGHINYLTALARPDYGVVLMVGLAHAGEFGSLQTTIDTKTEMVTSLTAEGVAVLNAADPRVAQMAAKAPGRVLWFNGQHAQASSVTTGVYGSKFTLELGDETVHINFPVLGEHHINNALAAAVVAHDLGLAAAEIKSVLEETVRPAKWRMEVLPCRDSITVINDAYNASPESVDAALKTLAQITEGVGRSIAVLGELSELGAELGAAYDRIGLQAVRLRLDQLVVVGKHVRRMYVTAVNEGAWDESTARFFENADEALAYLKAEVKPYDTVLVKSSNSAGLRFLGDELAEALQ